MKLSPIAAQKSECAIGTCDNWTIGLRFRLFRTFDLAPLSGRVALGGRFPGLKPWAEFCSPCGAKNKGLSPRIVPDSSFGAKSSEALHSRLSGLVFLITKIKRPENGNFRSYSKAAF
jgi:hypothetical protein